MTPGHKEVRRGTLSQLAVWAQEGVRGEITVVVGGAERSRADSDPQQLAFELEGALLTANWYFHLYADPGYLGRARRAVQARLASEATPTGRRALRPTPQTGETGATGEQTTQGERR